MQALLIPLLATALLAGCKVVDTHIAVKDPAAVWVADQDGNVLLPPGRVPQALTFNAEHNLALVLRRNADGSLHGHSTVFGSEILTAGGEMNGKVKPVQVGLARDGNAFVRVTLTDHRFEQRETPDYRVTIYHTLKGDIFFVTPRENIRAAEYRASYRGTAYSLIGAGAVVAALGGLILAAQAPDDQRDPNALSPDKARAIAGGMLGLGIVAVGTGVWGLSAWNSTWTPVSFESPKP